MSYDKCGCREQSWAGEHDDECPFERLRAEVERLRAALIKERDAAVERQSVVDAEVERLRVALSNTAADLASYDAYVPVHCHVGHRILVDDGEGTDYVCPACANERLRAAVQRVRDVAAEMTHNHDTRGCRCSACRVLAVLDAALDES